MVTWFGIVFLGVVLQRLVELKIAQSNSQFVKAAGGYEIGREHYPIIVLLHISFFLSLAVETFVTGNFRKPPVVIFFTTFLLAQFLRIWVIISLKKMWNTRIILIPNSKPVTWGPYRYLKHPNYLVVMIEFLTLPLSFGALWTAFIFSILNFAVLHKRINVEEAGLKQLPAFKDYFNSYKSG